jgi:predicted flavoprotein YhiN
MAAEVARAAGADVQLYDRLASAGRKFLIAGKGGLNLTHSEDFDTFAPAILSARSPARNQG